jgi:multiple antibiotic resistance protein
MTLFTSTFLLVFAGLFPIVNPLGSAPIFLGLTASSTRPERHALARKVAVNSFFLLLGSLFIGSHVLEFFGISLPVLRIAGGLVVAAFGWNLLNSGVPADKGHEATASSEIDSFYPLTMPLTVGPGSISVAITLGSQRPNVIGAEDLALVAAAAIVGLLAIVLSVYLCYRFAERLVAGLGQAGTNVVIRLSAFILFCIGIQIVWRGWSTLTSSAA